MATFLVASSQAQLFPARPDDTFVADTANLISPQGKIEITQSSRDLLQQTGAPIVVVTVPSLASVNAKDIGIEAYAHQMFDTWRIGSRYANHGILLVVAKDDRKARIELGSDWDHRYDGDSHKIMTSDILPAFKRGDYSTGIVNGVHALKKMTTTAASESGTPDSDDDSSIFPWMLVLIGGSVIALVVIFRRPVQRSLSTWSASQMNSGTSPYRSNNAYSQTPDYTTDYTTPTVIVIDNSSNDNSFSSYDSGSSDSGGGFDSGSSGGGGDTGSW